MIDLLLDRWTPKSALNTRPSSAPPGPGEPVATSIALAQWRLRARAALVEESTDEAETLSRTARGLADGLANASLAALSPTEKRAFWLNIYNALIAHAIVQGSVGQPRWRRPRGLYRRFAWWIAGDRFTADAIEHGVLRANRGHRWLWGPSFGSRDPRRRQVLEDLDARIHAALHCGAESCPPVQVYHPDRLDTDLERALVGLVESSSRWGKPGGVLEIHPVLYAYRKDFGGEAALIQRITRILALPQASEISELRPRKLSSVPAL